MSGLDGHVRGNGDVRGRRADFDQSHGDRLGDGHGDAHAAGRALTLGHRGRRDRHGEGRQFGEHTEDLRDQFRAVDEGIAVALVLGVDQMVATALGFADRILEVPLQEGREVGEGAGGCIGFVRKPQVERLRITSVIAHRHVKHGPRNVAFFLRTRRPDAALPVVVIVKAFQTIGRRARRIQAMERIGLVVKAVAAGGVHRATDRPEIEKIGGVGPRAPDTEGLGPKVLARPGIHRDRGITIPRGVPGRHAAVAVDEPDVDRVGRILIEDLQCVPRVGPGRGVRNDRVIADDAVQRGFQSGPGQTFSRRIVSLRRGVLRMAPGLECNEQN